MNTCWREPRRELREETNRRSFPAICYDSLQLQPGGSDDIFAEHNRQFMTQDALAGCITKYRLVKGAALRRDFVLADYRSWHPVVDYGSRDSGGSCRHGHNSVDNRLMIKLLPGGSRHSHAVHQDPGISIGGWVRE